MRLDTCWQGLCSAGKCQLGWLPLCSAYYQTRTARIETNSSHAERQRGAKESLTVLSSVTFMAVGSLSKDLN